ncbi:MAG TPA: hypothetical protein VFW83_08540 [Bryobacteraceae bacterium]|nr:hypothetical protein [Bryobacteraceae bacterium]
MLKLISAYACLLLGALGLFLPLLPGIPLLIVGVGLLEPDHPVRRRLARWLPWKRKKS